MQRPCLFAWAIAASLCAATVPCWASCGSAYCTLMTDRYAQGTGDPHLGWSADQRIEQVNQTRLLTGTNDIDASQVSNEDAIERHTRNLNVVTTLGYGFSPQWSVSLRLPVVHRDHLHDLIDAETGLATTPEQWRFTRLGDVQWLARRQFLADDVATSYALYGGLKLPTGTTTVTNADGVRAERALQPGTGTTDLVLGVAIRHALGAVDAAFGQASVSQALDSHEAFKPGARVEVAAGWSRAFSEAVGGVVQLNARWRGHDRGAQAEPDNSGSTTIDISPGLTLAVGGASTFYAFVQVPIYQRVTGIQLVPRVALAVGWTRDF